MLDSFDNAKEYVLQRQSEKFASHGSETAVAVIPFMKSQCLNDEGSEVHLVEEDESEWDCVVTLLLKQAGSTKENLCLVQKCRAHGCPPLQWAGS